MGAVKAPFERGRLSSDRKNTAVWALRDISFEVEQGDVIGIIGRNGAGKSTLLKVLSRVTRPTSGRAIIRGRVGSLLEVGTGFHPELTGRENIYLNAAILGMKKGEIDRRFDEIVAFSEIGRFLDTPVKRYSSGMYVRLAFAVAAHLDPEILVVDEVLAVGDAEFQKKCLGKMENVAKTGRTVLFVSHNMAAVISLCNRCLLIDKGRLVEDGDTASIVTLYQSSIHSSIKRDSDLAKAERYGSGKATFTSIQVQGIGPDGTSNPFLRTGQDLKVTITVEAHSEISDTNVELIIYDSTGYRLVDANSGLQGNLLSLKPGQQACVEFHLQNLLLRQGLYLIGLWLGRDDVEHIDWISYAASLSVEADAEQIRYSKVFPGTYQCRYTHRITVNAGRSRQVIAPE